MDKPSVWRAVVSSTDPRRARDPGSQSSRPGSAMGYRLYDMDERLLDASSLYLSSTFQYLCLLERGRASAVAMMSPRTLD
ncbi:Piezo-type mechanosensitive ion channel like [Dissostichus eleginoides]|uniref:Piezo-type mechanosensitive ion channel like n=1 Tax=Dissostichus eleginoides TaxID=100907 RepID=A0AAD9C9L1_DISEL|nr:Piezo-type mechanosensitive ion channel like [Dissostichus eleginoides]